MTHYLKAIVALIGGVSAWGLTAASDNAITMAEWFGLVGALATALGVLTVPNSPVDADAPPDEGGWSEIALIVLGFVLAVVVLILLGRLS
jgi:hypothetical protein